MPCGGITKSSLSGAATVDKTTKTVGVFSRKPDPNGASSVEGDSDRAVNMPRARCSTRLSGNRETRGRQESVSHAVACSGHAVASREDWVVDMDEIAVVIPCCGCDKTLLPWLKKGPRIEMGVWDRPGTKVVMEQLVDTWTHLQSDEPTLKSRRSRK